MAANSAYVVKRIALQFRTGERSVEGTVARIALLVVFTAPVNASFFDAATAASSAGLSSTSFPDWLFVQKI